jgi:heme/copper-type cytochrome/quinol oxidase subunit 1
MEIDTKNQKKNIINRIFFWLTPVAIILVFSIMFVVKGPVQDSLIESWNQPLTYIPYSCTVIFFLVCVVLSLKYCLKYKKISK